MRRLLVIALLAAVAGGPDAAAADLTVESTVAFTRPDGSQVPVAQRVRVWCGRWDPDVPVRSVRIRAGARGGPFWQLRAVVADVRRRPVVRFPNDFVWDDPSGAQLFMLDGENELSSSEEEASGTITFQKVRCGRRLDVRFRVDGVLGSEFSDGDELTVRGSFRASK
jgi:hypothetical protein